MYINKYKAWDTNKNIMYSAEELGKDELTINPDGRGFVNVDSTDVKLSQYYFHIIPLQFTNNIAKRFGTTATKKHHFLRQNLIANMQLQDNIAEFDASGDQIKYEFAKKALILSGNFGIKLTKEDHLRFSIDLIEFLKTAGEIDGDQYETYVKILRRILSPSQFNSLKKLMAP